MKITMQELNKELKGYGFKSMISSILTIAEKDEELMRDLINIMNGLDENKSWVKDKNGSFTFKK